MSEVPKIHIETLMELAIRFACEENDFSDLQGFTAIEHLYLISYLMYINMEEINKEIRKTKRKK